MARFVSHTNGTETVDGRTGKNNRMERGDSTVANPIWEPAAPNSPKQRFDSPKYASQTGGYGEVCVTRRSISTALLALCSLGSRSLTWLVTTQLRTLSVRNCGGSAT